VEWSDRDLVGAREAGDRAILIAALFMVWGAFSLVTLPAQPFVWKNTLQAVVGAVGLAFFAFTRRRPRRLAADVYTTLVVGYSLVLLPWVAIIWARLGRPWEALAVPQVGMLAMSLVAPHRLWAGIALVTAFAVETAFASLYAQRIGLGLLMPTTEPYLTLIIATLSLYIVSLRRRRHQLVLAQIRLAAESEALGHLEPLFANVRDQMRDSLRAISAALVGVDEAHSKRGMTRALHRIGDVSDRIHQLVDHSDEEPAALAVTERQFIAADTHYGAMVMAASSASLAIFFITLAAREELPSLLLAVMVAIAGACLAWLWATHGRTPSLGGSAIFILLLWMALLTVATCTEPRLARFAIGGRRPFTPFIPHKLLLVTMPLLAPALRWITPLALVITMADALALYVVEQLSAHSEVVSLVEPWTTLAFALVGFLLMGLREQRLVASIGMLRAESRRAAVERRAHLLLALRDQLNTPLQALVLYVAEGAKRTPLCDQGVSAEVERLVAMSRRLATVEEAELKGALAFDAREALRRR
jgi:hypothetical protein